MALYNFYDLIGYGLFASRPTAGIMGRLYFASDTGQLWRDNGSIWQLYQGEALINPMTDVGDIIIGLNDGDPGALAMGEALQVLRVNATGQTLEWADPPSGGSGDVTLIDSQTPDGVSVVTFAGISQAFSSLRLDFVAKCAHATNLCPINLNLNQDSTIGNYRLTLMSMAESGSYSFGGDSSYEISSYVPGQAAGQANLALFGYLEIPFYTCGFHKQINIHSQGYNSWSNAFEMGEYKVMRWANTAAITRIDIPISGSEFDAGSKFNLYGIN